MGLQWDGSEATLATDGACERNGDADAVAGAGVFYAEGHVGNVAIRLPRDLEQTNQTGEMAASLLAARTAGLQTALTQETDSMTILNALTKLRKHHEDTGYIGQKNSSLTRATLACLRGRKAHTTLVWVKGHSGHPRNEGADRLAGRGAKRAEPDELDITIPKELKISGAKLSAITQKLAYKAIRERKAAKLPARRATEAVVGRVVEDVERLTGRKIKPRTFWDSLTKTAVSRECRQFLWKTAHDAFMVGDKWRRPKMSDELQARAVCSKCNVTESMDHILFQCEAVGRSQVWELLREHWEGTGYEPRELCWGTIVGAPCMTARADGGVRLLDAKSELWTILATESAYLVWKLRCERVIQNEGSEFTVAEVENRWRSVILGRAVLDHRSTAKSLGSRALNEEAVQSTWAPLARNIAENQAEFEVSSSEVLAGIIRRLSKRRTPNRSSNTPY